MWECVVQHGDAEHGGPEHGGPEHGDAQHGHAQHGHTKVFPIRLGHRDTDFHAFGML